MKKWLPVIVLGLAQFVLVIDGTDMNVSIRAVVTDLHTTVSSMGTTLLIKSVTTGDGCGITDIEVTCPTARATPRGDYGCTVRRDPDGRV